MTQKVPKQFPPARKNYFSGIYTFIRLPASPVRAGTVCTPVASLRVTAGENRDSNNINKIKE
jgi:hypothetical protein